jgi:O-acetyl-ADP-ribose deacetylase (regulator of RNase III)
MRIKIGKCLLELKQGDITQQTVDVIVNAANKNLIPGGGVDGAIHRAGGESILSELQKFYPQGCPTGQAVITSAGKLKALSVIHVVGPVWRGGRQQEPDLLASCYQEALILATGKNYRSLAFPAVSTGIYGYPLDLASRVSLKKVIQYLHAYQSPELVLFVLYDQPTYAAFAYALEELIKAS